MMKRRGFLGSALGLGMMPWAEARQWSRGMLQFPGGPAIPFLHTAAGSASPAAFTVPVLAAGAASPCFTLSVASGDPQPSGITLWTRVDPSALQPSQTTVTWMVARSINFEAPSIVLSGSAPISAGVDNTVKVRLNDVALQPGVQYYYRFVYGSYSSRAGQFKTLPSPSSTVRKLRLGYISCQDYTNGYYTALAALAQEDIDYVVHLGDYIYESVGDPIFQSGQVRPIGLLPSGQTVAQTLDDYRFLYRTYRSDENLQAVHERCAFIQLWDDHEFANDCWQDFFADHTPTPGQEEPALRLAANQAWSEYSASGIPFNASAGPLGSLQLYRSFVFGDLTELIVTDERLYRDGPPCGLETAQRYLTAGCPAQFDAARTMLGGTQRDWFLGRMTGSPAQWKIWANEVMCMQLKAINTQNKQLWTTLDQWDGYQAERTNLLTALGSVRNVVTITGDIHSFAAGYLKPDFNSADSPAVAVELVGGSVSSSNLNETVKSQLPLVSSPIPREALGTDFNVIQTLLKAANPHLEFFDSTTHGYVILDITPQRITAAMKQVSSITQSSASSQLLRAYRIPANQVLLQRV